MLLSGVSVEEAAEVAERIRASISGHPVETPSGPCEAKVSLGVVPVDETASTVTDILHRASRILKESKVHGKNQVTVARVH